ncbi:class I SAM-dependent methyltransferase [Olivibacter sp. SDN3]|nr:class I SAM-dependent methyltransferase [Olivibacter sp. SDN3]
MGKKNTEQNYIATNRQSWNKRTEVHLKSKFYDVKGFIAGKTSLNAIELDLLGDIEGKSILHLQCHFGQDSISLSRLGATVIGVDLSDKAIEQAEQIAKATKANVSFICCDIYGLPKYLDQQFDLVFTSYGTISWLPDLNQWAKIISRFLKPNGRFIFVEFHPVIWMFDEGLEKIDYSYFNSGAIIETESGTYADRTADIHYENIMWNHGLGEVTTSLIKNELEINSLEEYDYSPYNIFNKSVEVEPKKYRIAHLDKRIPMVYSIVATKKSNS